MSRQNLIRKILSPPNETHKWREESNNIHNSSFDNISMISADTEEEEHHWDYASVF